VQGLEGDGRAALKMLVKSYGTPPTEVTMNKHMDILRLKVSPFPTFVKEFETLYIPLCQAKELPLKKYLNQVILSNLPDSFDRYKQDFDLSQDPVNVLYDTLAEFRKRNAIASQGNSSSISHIPAPAVSPRELTEQVNAATVEKKCSFCKKEGHLVAQCFSKMREDLLFHKARVAELSETLEKADRKSKGKGKFHSQGPRKLHLSKPKSKDGPKTKPRRVVRATVAETDGGSEENEGEDTQ
jgi:hypothetical protein